jgi:hypothetical protein
MLAFGRDWDLTGQLLRTNFFSFTEPNHPLLMHQWAFCLVAFEIYKFFGASGLIVLKWLSLWICLLAIDSIVRQRTTSAFVQLTMMVVVASCLFLGFELLRAQVVAMDLLALLLVIVGLRTWRWFFACPFLFLIWSSSHGSFPLGWIVLALAAIQDLSFHRSDSRAVLWIRLRNWGAVLIASIGACYLHPYRAGLLDLALQHTQDSTLLLVGEWQPLWQNPHRDLVLVIFALVFGLTTWLTARRNPFEWILAVMGMVLSILAIRHLRFAPLLLVPAITLVGQRCYDLISSPWQKRADLYARGLAALTILVCLVFMVCNMGHVIHFLNPVSPGPAKALAVMKRNHLSGRIWNDFDWGGDVMWALPDSQVACDGRSITAYSDEFLGRCIPFGYQHENPLAILKQYGADYALLPPENPAVKYIAAAWTMIYCDASACLFSAQPRSNLLPLDSSVQLTDFY